MCDSSSQGKDIFDSMFQTNQLQNSGQAIENNIKNKVNKINDYAKPLIESTTGITNANKALAQFAQLNCEDLSNVSSKGEEPKRKDSMLGYLKLSTTIKDELINSSPTLTLIQEEGTLLPQKEIKVNAGGLVNGGGRKAQDGVALFGISDEKFKNDIEINLKNPKFETYKHYPYIFAVYYQQHYKGYFLRAYSGEESDQRILFIQLNSDYELKIKKREMLSIGNCIFLFIPKNNTLEVQCFSDKEKHINIPTKVFYPTDKMITIGREKSCTYAFSENKSFSRVQTRIIYDVDKDIWIVKDGSDTKPSTNGTWLFGVHDFEIKNDLLVEILASKIRFKIE